MLLQPQKEVDFLATEFIGLTWFAREEMMRRATVLQSNALQHTGLLTDMIERVTGQCAQIKVVTEGLAGHAFHRLVELHGGNKIAVVAYSLIPEATRSAHPWLMGLGDRPLGKALQTRDLLERSEFEFAQSQWRYTRIANSASYAETWVRKFKFLLESGDIEVTEMLGPQFLLDMGKQC